MLARSGRFEHSHWAGLGENLSKKFSTDKQHYYSGSPILYTVYQSISSIDIKAITSIYVIYTHVPGCRRRCDHRLVRGDRGLQLRWGTRVRGGEREAKDRPLHAARVGGRADGWLRQSTRARRQHRVHCGALPPDRQPPQTFRRTRVPADQRHCLVSSKG